jgi:NodT family efflux transporter outer membrane factor (OMF) lipoprotein
LFAFGAMLMAGCAAVGPNYKAPEVKVMPRFGELSAATTQPSTPNAGPAEAGKWWSKFNDLELDKLVDRAVTGNLDLQEAQSRLRQSRFEMISAGAVLAPQIGVDGGYNHARGSSNVVIPSGALGKGLAAKPFVAKGAPAGATPPSGALRAEPAGITGGSSAGGGPQSPLGEGGLPGVVTDVYQVGFDASWEIDVFGGERRGIEAAAADAAAAAEDQRDVLVTLAGEVARNYVQLRGYQRQANIARENLQLQESTLELTQSKYKNGFVTQLDVARQTAQVATTAAEIPPLEYQERVAIHSLGILLGEDPTALMDELAATEPIPPLPPEVPVGLPSDLLRRRPDIRRAERRLAAATARVGQATADFYPKFTITGLLGVDSTSPRHLFDYSSRYYEIVPGMSWSILNGGQVQANVDIHNEQQKQAGLEYQQTVLNALKEVEDSLAAYRTEQLRRRALADAVAASRQAVDLAREQYRQGVIDFLTVLDAERELLAAQDSLTTSERMAGEDLVALYKALGGGWDWS